MIISESMTLSQIQEIMSSTIREVSNKLTKIQEKGGKANTVKNESTTQSPDADGDSTEMEVFSEVEEELKKADNQNTSLQTTENILPTTSKGAELKQNREKKTNKIKIIQDIIIQQPKIRELTRKTETKRTQKTTTNETQKQKKNNITNSKKWEKH